MTNSTNTWFFVADRSRAQVFEATRDGLHRVHSFDEPAVRAHASELITGDRGRRSDEGPGRSALEPQTSVQQTEVDRFVHAIGDWLHLQADAQAFDALILVAAPQMLGELRPILSTPTAEKLVDTLDKDYTQLPLKELEARLRAAFPEHLASAQDTVPAGARRGQPLTTP